MVKKKQNKIVITFPHEQKMVIHLGVLITPIDNPRSKRRKVIHQSNSDSFLSSLLRDLITTTLRIIPLDKQFENHTLAVPYLTFPSYYFIRVGEFEKYRQCYFTSPRVWGVATAKVVDSNQTR